MREIDKDLELGSLNGGCLHVEEHERDGHTCDSTDMVKNYLKDDQGGMELDFSEGESGKFMDLKSKQFRLRRAVSDVRFKARLAPVHPDKKVRVSLSLQWYL